ncbi:MAG: hypothetical protein EZS28_008432 [Streblomastix strix]|uniref:OTU domain-containing protein n=1 Tax=Streblomastix strix TaxID=222440 RepID=A0A5J4WMD1_9EUKA|nr:MAG: hypothetical protein EZS28_008432 [Streblomastix strix]
MKRIGCYRKNEEIILFVDGHFSRGDENAQQILSQAGVTMITYPGELTPIQQSRDKFKSNSNLKNKLTREDKRVMVIYAALDAIQKSTFRSNRLSSFESTGLYPRNSKRVTNQKGVINDSINPKYPNGRQTAPITSKIINAIETPNKEQNNSKSDTNSTIMEFDSDEYIDESYVEKKMIKDNESEQDYNGDQNSSNSISEIISGSSKNFKSNSESEDYSETQKEPYQDDNTRAINRLIQFKRLRLVENRAGGDCFFRAMSQIIYNNENLYVDIRRQAVLYIQMNKLQFQDAFVETGESAIKKKKRYSEYEDFKEMVDRERKETIEDYCLRMRNKHELAVEVIISATAWAFKRSITIYLSNGQTHDHIIPKNRLNASLAFIDTNHYIAMIRRN